jgi:hypothetical protein
MRMSIARSWVIWVYFKFSRGWWRGRQFVDPLLGSPSTNLFWGLRVTWDDRVQDQWLGQECWIAS